MKNLLLDSNALIRYVSLSKKIGPKTRRLLDSSNLFFSPISLFELKFKEARIPGFISPLSRDLLTDLGFSELGFVSDAAENVVRASTRDPFDIMLLSQARAQSMLFVTADLEILNSELEFVLDLTD